MKTVACAVAAAAVLALPVPRAAAAGAVCDATTCTFLSPNRSIGCSISVGAAGTPDSAFCAWSDGNRAQTVRLLPNGVLEPCINPMADVVERCTWAPPAAAPVLGYGQTAVLGPFTCLAEAQGISCTAAPTGKGFTITSLGILPVLPPPPPPPDTAVPVESPPPTDTAVP